MKIIIIGRSTDNDVVINDIKISKHHLQLIQNGNGECSVVDLNSTNGTYVNGERIIGETCLLPNDQVRIGDTILQWQNYINSAGAQNVKDQQLSQKPKPRKRTPIIYIILLVVALLIVGLVCLYFINQAKTTKDQETAAIEQQYKNKVEELKAKEDWSLNLRKEANKAYEQAMKTQSNEDLAKYNKLKEEADKAETDLNKLKAENEKIANAKATADSLARIANKERDAANEAERAAKEAKEDAEQKRLKAESAKEAALEAEQQERKSKELTIEFYKEYSKLSSSQYTNVCDSLKINYERKKQKEALEDKFNSVENSYKQKIIDVIKWISAQKESPKIATDTTNLETVQPVEDSNTCLSGQEVLVDTTELNVKK